MAAVSDSGMRLKMKRQQIKNIAAKLPEAQCNVCMETMHGSAMNGGNRTFPYVCTHGICSECYIKCLDHAHKATIDSWNEDNTDYIFNHGLAKCPSCRAALFMPPELVA